MKSVHESTKIRLAETQERMRRYADRKRQDAPVYKVGDLVMLNGRNIQTRRPTKKMDHKNHGPFLVEKIVSPHAIQLALPRNWRIHNVFHVSLLEPYRRSALRESPDAAQILRDTDDIEYSEEYDVDEVMAATQRTKKSRVMYLVKWLDYPARKDWTQEPYESFSVGGREKLVIFHTKFPDAPRDPRLIMP